MFGDGDDIFAETKFLRFRWKESDSNGSGPLRAMPKDGEITGETEDGEFAGGLSKRRGAVQHQWSRRIRALWNNAGTIHQKKVGTANNVLHNTSGSFVCVEGYDIVNDSERTG